jgi:hypothetical protein
LDLIQLLVALLDGRRLFGHKRLQESQEASWLEGLKEVIRLGTLMGSRRTDHDNRQLGVNFLDLCDEVTAGHIAYAGVQNYAADVRERG